MAPFYGWGSTASRLEPLRGGSLLFTTKFPEVPGTHFIDLLDHGATISLKLSSDHYRRSPLFQGGLEIPCIVTVTMAGTVRNHMVLDRYKEIVNRLYCEPKNEVITGCFLAKNKDADTVALDSEVTVPKKEEEEDTKKS